MEIIYHGGNCVEIAVKKGTLVVDGNVSTLGAKDINPKSGVQLFTQREFVVNSSPDQITIDGPGEYEVGEFSVKGIAAKRMIDASDVKKSTIYRIVGDGIAVAIMGHVDMSLSDEQLEEIGVIDVAVVPIGGGGYTLDGHQASSVIRQLAPKVIIPTHYSDESLSYEVPQSNIESFIKELGVPHEVVPRLKIKNGILPDTLTIVEITRS